MDGIQSAVDSLTSSSARLRALTVSTPSETVDVTVTGVTQGIADDVTVTGVTQGIADDETYGNPDDTYDDVDAEGLPAPPPQRGRTLDTSTDEVDEADGDGNDRDGDGDLDGDAPPPPRCKACRGWGHRTRSDHACPKNISKAKYLDHMNELIARGATTAIECLPWNEIYPENTPAPEQPFKTNILSAPTHKLFTAKDWKPLNWVQQNEHKSPAFTGEKEQDMEEYEKLITVEFERLKAREASRHLRNGETRKAEEELEAQAKVNVRVKNGPEPRVLGHLDFQLSVARSKLGLPQAHQSLLKKSIDVKKKRKAAECLKHTKASKRQFNSNPIPYGRVGKGLEKNRSIKFHAMHSKEDKKDRRCQVCAMQGQKLWGQSKKKTYRNGKKFLPRAKFLCVTEGCLSNYCSSQCFNMYHYGEENPSDLGEFMASAAAKP